MLGRYLVFLLPHNRRPQRICEDDPWVFLRQVVAQKKKKKNPSVKTRKSSGEPRGFSLFVQCGNAGEVNSETHQNQFKLHGL